MNRRRVKGFEDELRPAEGASASFLVRAREEEAESGAVSIKIFVRNLQTGREQYVSDPAQLGELVLRYLREAHKSGSDLETTSGDPGREADDLLTTKSFNGPYQ